MRFFQIIPEEEFVSSPVFSSAIENNISLDLLKKVIHARIDEIFNLSLKNINFEEIVSEIKVKVF